MTVESTFEIFGDGECEVLHDLVFHATIPYYTTACVPVREREREHGIIFSALSSPSTFCFGFHGPL